MFSDSVVQMLQILVFFGFFCFSAACIYLSKRLNQNQSENIKKAFVLSLVIGMTVSMFVGTFPPFVNWGFFSEPAPESTTQYTVVVVDENGTEYEYPHEAAPPGRVHNRGEEIATGTDNAHQNRMSDFLLEQAKSHKRSLENGLSVVEWIRYRSLPGLLGRNQWTQSEAAKMGELEMIRVYRTTIDTSSDGLRIDSKKTELVYEFRGD
jgi:hypothetical protein